MTPSSKQLWEAAIAFEEAIAAEDMVKQVLELCERAAAAPKEEAEGKPAAAHLSEKDREEFSLRAIEFADEHGTMAEMLACERRHAADFLLPANVANEGRKRHAEAAAADAAARPAKRQAEASPAANGAAAAGYYGHAQAYQGYYGAGYQQYPAATQYPAAAYGQQYGGYGYGY